MRIALTIVLLFVYGLGFCQDTTSLRQAVKRLQQALVEKDEATLNALLHPSVSYGHSNGWIETKQDLIDNLKQGKLVYHSIEAGALTMYHDRKRKLAIVRGNIKVAIALNNKAMVLKLHVMEVWLPQSLKKDRGWWLLSRQSTKIE